MLLNPLTFHAPTTISEAIKLYKSFESVKLQAGGTFLLNSLKLLKRKGNKTPEHIISLKKIDALKGVSLEQDRLVIKSMTTINELAGSSLLRDNFDVLKIVCKNISTNPIRNMATVGGNLTCRYTWTEMPATMIGLEADMHFAGPDGESAVIRAEDFFKNAAKTDKIFTHLTIKRDPSARIAYRRIKKSPNVDIPLLSLLIKTNFKGGQFSNTRVSINNCVAFAQRDYKLENFLNQSSCSEKIGQEALDHLDESIYDTRSSDYKKYIFRVSLKDAIMELVNKEQIYGKS